MIILKGTTDQIVANTAAAASPSLTGFCSFRVRTSTTFEPDRLYSDITNTPAAVVCDSPSSASESHIIDYIKIHNADNITHTVSVYWTDGSNFATLWIGDLLTEESAEYVDGFGWRVSTASGVLKENQNAAGSATEIQYNSGGQLAGDVHFTWDDVNDELAMTGTNPCLRITGVTTSPSVPSTGFVKLFMKKLGGQLHPTVLTELGSEQPLQRALWNQYRVSFRPGAAAGVWSGTVGANLGTAAIALPTSTNIYTAMRRSTFATVVTTTNQQVGTRTEAMFWRGNATGLGGFFLVCRMGFTVIKTSSRAFIGLCADTTAIVTADPSTKLNLIGFGFDTGDTAFTFMHNDGSGTATKDPISGQGTLATNNTSYDFLIYAKPNDSVVYYRMVRRDTGAVLVDSSASSNLPVNTTLLCAQCVGSNGTANIAVGDMTLGIGIFDIYTEN